MYRLKTPILAALFLLVAGVANSLQAQTPRNVVMVTAQFKFQGNQVTTGLVPGSADTYSVTYSGQSANLQNGRSRSSLTITLQYKVNGNVGTVIGGQWAFTESVKDRATFITGGAISAGAQLNLKAGNTVGQGALALNLEVGDPTWPVSAVFTGTLDKSRTPKLSGGFTMTYPVIP
jgi:hypothetical protein